VWFPGECQFEKKVLAREGEGWLVLRKEIKKSGVQNREIGGGKLRMLNRKVWGQKSEHRILKTKREEKEGRLFVKAWSIWARWAEMLARG